MNNKLYKIMVVSTVSVSLLIAVYSGESAAGLFDGGKKSDSAKEETEKVSAPQKANVLSLDAVIKFDSLSHDFGPVLPDSMNSCLFKFTNVGTGTLEITATKGTCKCTVPELKKKDYAPGESGEIAVTFHAPKFQGAATQSVFVSSNDANNPKVELRIKADVQTQIQVEPEKMTLSLFEPNGGAQDITLKSKDGKQYAITKITFPGNVFTIDFDSNNVSDVHTLKLKVDIEALRRFLSGSVIIETNHPECKTVKVDYTCMREFETSPAAIIIRDAVENKTQKRTIYLTSNYNQEIVVDSVVSDNGIVKVVGQKQTENRFEFEVEITPPARKGKLRVFSDTLHINLKGKVPINVPCRGFFSPSR
ncbi:MAG: DUF1573 domain-containing protein [Phycisphaerae bacterium]|nr:DUF1573 domain-containing protein [Phycisphaerae bacterium]